MSLVQSIKSRIDKWFHTDIEVKKEKLTRGTNDGGNSSADNSSIDGLQNMLSLDHTLMMRYIDYEEMDDYPELSSALDVFSNDSTIPDSVHGRTVWAQSKDKVVRDIIDDLLHRILNIEDDIWLLARTTAKYGNCYCENIISSEGVLGINWLPVPTVRRIIDTKGTLVGFLQDTTGRFSIKNQADLDDVKKYKKELESQGIIFFMPWEVTHWRLRGKSMRSVYGTGVFDSGRWIWKRLQLLEDTTLLYKLMKSPSRFAYYVDVGDLPNGEAISYVNKIKRSFKKKTLLNPVTGKLDFRNNPLTPLEDLWIPTRGGRESTRVDVLSGIDWQDTDLLEYLRNKLYAAIPTPKSYFDGSSDNSRALAQQDARFARACMRLQREIRNGIKKIVRIHLALLDINPDAIEWDIKMTVPSAIFELQQIEVLNAQADLADRLEKYMPRDFVMQRILHFSDDEAAYITDAKSNERENDAKSDAHIQAEIQKMYPGLEIGDGGGLPGAEESIQSIFKKTNKKLETLTKSLTETIKYGNEMTKGLSKIEPKLNNVDNGIKRLTVNTLKKLVKRER